ncbi:hypothetical protein L1D50_17325 [Pseudoalteromonas sp. Isolate6]|uniref:hypothetical protein n=1 Tax=Pseudoalteromonas sp. Isolate6 TaxID=2908527 RepID=UPI001EFCC835|nr:hypothetical protein [Pseudoalteromonas sp. Isolate6]MCG9760863.1 hypothetical protein [Pseudoalteromonas sp. Isolate6]
MPTITYMKCNVDEKPLRQALYWMDHSAKAYVTQDESTWHIHYEETPNIPNFRVNFEQHLNDYILRHMLELDLGALKAAIIKKSLLGLAE